MVFESGYLPIGEEDSFCCIGSLLPAGPVAELVKARKMRESPFEITSRSSNDAHSGKRIIVQLACRDSHDVAPIELLFFEWNAFFFH